MKRHACLYVYFAILVFVLSGCLKYGSGQSCSTRTKKASKDFGILFDFTKDFEGFLKSDGPRYFNRETIFDHIDGGAEVYLEHGFEKVMNFELAKRDDDGLTVAVDIYDMGSLDNAKSIFLREKSGRNLSLDLAAGATVGPNMLRFYQDKFYVKVMSFPEIKEAPLVDVARVISSKVGES